MRFEYFFRLTTRVQSLSVYMWFRRCGTLLPGFAGCAPWDPYARAGRFSSLTRGVERANHIDIIRATLEWPARIKRARRDVRAGNARGRRRRADSGIRRPARGVDGRAVANNFLMMRFGQIDILGDIGTRARC